MSANSKIGWTNASWNPVTGCDKVSQGCKFCYAETLSKGRLSHLPEYAAGFNKVICHTDRLQMPGKWKKPKMIFVNSMSDLFHEDVPFEFIDSVFSVMSDYDYHTYQILTKRPHRMLAYFEWKKLEMGFTWKPKTNIWGGVSVEDQENFNDRVPALLKSPFHIKFISAEPLLEKINFTLNHKIGPSDQWTEYHDVLAGHQYSYDLQSKGPAAKLDWVIVGGESGHKARPMHPDWVESIRNDCEIAGIPFFFKQWGEYKDGWMMEEDSKKWVSIDQSGKIVPFKQGERLQAMTKLGKKKAGSLLNCIEHKNFPTIK